MEKLVIEGLKASAENKVILNDLSLTINMFDI